MGRRDSSSTRSHTRPLGRGLQTVVVTREATNVLTLDPAISTYKSLDGKYERVVEAHFLEPSIDGQPLRAMIVNSEDLISPLSRAWLEHVPDDVERLRGEGRTDGLEEGRAALLVCRVCGALDCGAVSARIQVGLDCVTWSDWMWVSWDAPQPIDDLPSRGSSSTGRRTTRCCPPRGSDSRRCRTTSSRTEGSGSSGHGSGVGACPPRHDLRHLVPGWRDTSYPLMGRRPPVSCTA